MRMLTIRPFWSRRMFVLAQDPAEAISLAQVDD